MTHFEKMLLYGLADLTAITANSIYTASEILDQWEEEVERRWPVRPRKEASTEDSFLEDVQEIYDAYPSSDKNNNGRTTRKGAKDKETIGNLLKSGKYTKDDLLTIIHQEVERLDSTDGWLRNFTTFLNNLPDKEEDYTSRRKKDEYR